MVPSENPEGAELLEKGNGKKKKVSIFLTFANKKKLALLQSF